MKNKKINYSLCIRLLTSFLMLFLSTYSFSTGNVIDVQFNVTENVQCDAPPKIELSGANALFTPGSNITIFALLTDRWNNPVDYWTYLNLSIYHQHELILPPSAMIKNSTGWYYLNYTISETAVHDSYSILVEGDPCGTITRASTGYRVGTIEAELSDEVMAYLQRINTTTVAINESLLAMNASYMRYFPVWNATFYFWNNSYFVNWNSSIMALQNNWSDLWSYFDCTGRGANNMLCIFLFEINATQKAYFPTWNASFWTWNNSYFAIWNSTIVNLNKNLSDLRDYWQCSGIGQNSLICNYLEEINNSVYSNTLYLTEINRTIGYIWEKFQRVNASKVLHNETVLSAVLNRTSNIKIWYNITIPLKQGYSTEDYLPLRIKYWFINLGNDLSSADDDFCVNQGRTFESAFPHCNPIIAQYVGKGNSTVNFNVTLQPSLTIGNYSVVRELEIDPNNIWITYSFATIGIFEVTEDMQINLTEIEIQATGTEDGKWNYIDKKVEFKSFWDNKPVQSIVRISGKLTSNLKPLQQGSLKVIITDTFLPNVIWTETYDNKVDNGDFTVFAGAEKQLSLIPNREYKLEIIACPGKTFSIDSNCNSYTTFLNKV
ncbi:MAG: hypothetical protein QXY62_04330 [Candidatus Altiarchaeota archaeon]